MNSCHLLYDKNYLFQKIKPLGEEGYMNSFITTNALYMIIYIADSKVLHNAWNWQCVECNEKHDLRSLR